MKIPFFLIISWCYTIGCMVLETTFAGICFSYFKIDDRSSAAIYIWILHDLASLLCSLVYDPDHLKNKHVVRCVIYVAWSIFSWIISICLLIGIVNHSHENHETDAIYLITVSYSTIRSISIIVFQGLGMICLIVIMLMDVLVSQCTFSLTKSLCCEFLIKLEILLPETNINPDSNKTKSPTFIFFKSKSEIFDKKERSVPRLPDDTNQCVICLRTYKPFSRLSFLKCQHHFHKKCLKQSMEKNSTCPMCRNQIEFFDSETTQTNKIEVVVE